MLRIRLQRIGKKKSPTYRLIVSERAKDTQAGSLEILGHYNPLRTEKVLEVKADRILHWIGQGAEPSNTVHNILSNAGIIESKTKKKAVRITKKREGKLASKKVAAEEEKKAKAEAKKAAAEAAKAEAEAKKAEEKAAAEAAKVEAEAKKAEEKAAAEAPAEETKAPAEETPAKEATEAPAEEAKA
ncbi:MAG: 30S ribosomal protein S16 [Candidatus Magasanikbacteria bacterium]|jgi:small subunit ribosomal protein S16|nr:30S ribosomal protein S16 [Candidatus Magasanikbacteria bacterium]